MRLFRERFRTKVYLSPEFTKRLFALPIFVTKDRRQIGTGQ